MSKIIALLILLVHPLMLASSDAQIQVNQPSLTDANEPRFSPAPLETVADIKDLLSQSFSESEFLPVDEAFSLTLVADTATDLVAMFKVADGYYLYKDKISFVADQQVANITLPEAKRKRDQYFGEVEIFDHDFSAVVALSENRSAATISATYQGCALDGICYAPVTRQFNLAELQRDFSGAAAARTISDRSLFGLLLGAFFAGLLLTFTPCVLPMLPILSGVIAGQGDKITRLNGAILAACYVAGTMVTYAAMGALAGATGEQLQAYFQNVWAIGALSTLFFIMALSMFGLFKLQIPTFIQSAIHRKTNRMGGSIPLVFLLGLFSSLIIGACVSPVLVSFLGLAVSGRDPLLGAQLMLSMALGMGVPLILLGIGAGHFIPRAGQWMEKVKQGFAVMLIGVAIYLLGLLPQVPVLLLWGGFFIVLAVFLITPKTGVVTTWQRIEKAAGIILLVWGIVLLVGGLLGQRDLLKPIPVAIFSAPIEQSQSESEVQFVAVDSVAELQRQFEFARADNKLIMLDYYADWCVDCVRMDKTTFSDARVIDRLVNDFISVRVDVTDPNHAGGKALKQRYDVFGPPATLFFAANGDPIKHKNFYGYKDKDEFLSIISDL